MNVMVTHRNSVITRVNNKL